MKAITDITIQENENGTVTMFLTYNNDPADYSFSPGYISIEEALSDLPKNDPYFPIKTEEYTVKRIGTNGWRNETLYL